MLDYDTATTAFFPLSLHDALPISTDRDALFLAMLAFAAMLASCILTVDTSFLILFFVFMLFGVAAFIGLEMRDRKSTRLNSSHVRISYAVFCLKKKNKVTHISQPI